VRALSASQLLAVWERGLHADPTWRALALLSEACPDRDAESLSHLTIGQRDGLLLRLREWTFGPQVTALAACSGCGEQIELSFGSADLHGPEPEPEASVAVNGFTLRLRPPNTSDLTAASHPDLAVARVQLLERCLLAARHLDTPVEAAQLPAAVLDAAERRLAEADPQADIALAVECPACGARRAAAFDIVSYFWREIEAWAVRVLRDVHALATAYGWSEREILALSPLRRQCYLDLVGA
jgi:hypothetical protein